MTLETSTYEAPRLTLPAPLRAGLTLLTATEVARA